MLSVTSSTDNGVCIIHVGGKIDSTNADEFAARIAESENGSRLIFDFEDLQYISSAGLRVLLRLRKKYKDIELINVSKDVYSIFDMTGFTQLMHVSRAYREVSIDGCEIVGRGANGIVYRTDPDTVVKVYLKPDALPEIQHEREVAKKALVLGLPTAISYDVVRVGKRYASMFEMVNAKSLSQLLAQDSAKLDFYVRITVDLMKQIHDTVVPEGDLPDQRLVAIKWAEDMQQYLPEDVYEKLHGMIVAVPHSDHMIHGDYHTKNIMLQNGDEPILIDMDTLAVGHPIFELCSMYNAFVGFCVVDPVEASGFLGYDDALAERFWRRSMEMYFNTTDEVELLVHENKAKLLGMLRIMRRCKRRNLSEETFERAKDFVCKLTKEIDSLT